MCVFVYISSQPELPVFFKNPKKTMPEDATLLVCVPGQRLCLADDATVSGSGTYERLGYIYAQLAGTVAIRPKDNVRGIALPPK